MSFIQVEQWQMRDARGQRKYVSAIERTRFLIAVETVPPEMRALCHVLAFTGCRISEALALTRDRIDVEAGVLIFQTLKRRKLIYRPVPVPLNLVHMLIALPVNDDGLIWHIHRSTAWRHVKRAMLRAQIRGPMTCPKGLRHGFGIRAAGQRVPPNLIQKWLGHSSIATTAIYLDAVGLEEREFAARTW